MATYKKRGYRTKASAVSNEEESETLDQIAAQSTTAEVFSTLDDTASKTEAWVANNQKYILSAIGIIGISVLGYLLFSKYIQEPKELEATNSMYKAQQLFVTALDSPEKSKDSLYNLAINGSETVTGFSDILSDYSGTKAANLSNYYVGFAQLRMNAYQKAIDHLDQFDSDDKILYPLALGGIGDAFSQLGQLDEALSYYKKAGNSRVNSYTTPKFLLKAAITALTLGKNKEAVPFLNKIKKEFPDSPEAKNRVPLLLGRAGTM